MGRKPLQQSLREQSAQQRAIHLNHVRQVQIERVAQRLLHRRMVTADVKHAVTAQKIEISVSVEIVKIGALRIRVNFVKTDHPLHLHKRAVDVALVQIVIFAEAFGHELFEI